jgi:hypothetical protein
MIGLVISASFADEIVFEPGDLLHLGQYNDAPMLWVVTGTDSSGHLNVVARNVIMLKAFDASGDLADADDFYSYAQYYGSNNWSASTLRRWLNATETAVEWSGVAPDAAHVFNGENPYSEEPGFLSSAYFPGAVLEAILPIDYETESGESAQDRVFLLTPAEYQMLFENSALTPLQLPTPEVVETSGFDAATTLNTGTAYPIWTRSASSNPYAVHAVQTMDSNGTASIGVASSGRMGVMPAMTLDTAVLASHYLQGDGNAGNPYVFSWVLQKRQNP